MKALAMDLGASGGKAFFGSLRNGRLSMTQVHRFANIPVQTVGHLYWDIFGIYRNLLEAVRLAAREGFESFGVDAFCNDYGLLSADGRLLNQVYTYRDARTANTNAFLDSIVNPMELYRSTGCQRARFNTLVQLCAQRSDSDAFLLEQADCLLFVPDLLNYFLCGQRAAEYTIASVSQAFGRKDGAWNTELLGRLGLRIGLFPVVVPPATRLGGASNEILSETGGNAFTVTTVCHHDTASAVLAVPAEEEPFVYISSGTWCLMGTETREMIVSEEAFRSNFANEGGFGGTNRFLKNIMGLWMMQECRRELERSGINRTFEELDCEAEHAEAFRSLIDPNNPIFFEPGDMIGRIQRRCEATGEPVPKTPGEITRCVLESLALTYRLTLEQIERIANIKPKRIHMIGGGAKSELLNRFAASAMGRPVLAGPVEAAAAGNLAAQFIAAGTIGGLWEARRIIADSFVRKAYNPQDADRWDIAYQRFLKIIAQSF